MKERHATRYDIKLLPKSMSKVTISWGVDSSVEANVANFCTHGMKVIIPMVMSPIDLPKKNDAIKVKLPIVQVCLTGMQQFPMNKANYVNSVYS
jgi:hypothetical protein